MGGVGEGGGEGRASGSGDSPAIISVPVEESINPLVLMFKGP